MNWKQEQEALENAFARRLLVEHGIKEVTTQRQAKNGTREFEFPVTCWTKQVIKWNKGRKPTNDKLRIAVFKSGYVRKQNGCYTPYQLNPVYKRDDLLRIGLFSLYAQDIQLDYEIIVIDDNFRKQETERSNRFNSIPIKEGYYVVNEGIFEEFSSELTNKNICMEGVILSGLNDQVRVTDMVVSANCQFKLSLGSNVPSLKVSKGENVIAYGLLSKKKRIGNNLVDN